MSTDKLTIDDLFKTMAALAQIPKPTLSYIVLDHAIPPGYRAIDEDANGRRYLHCSPAMLDELKHIKPEETQPGESIMFPSFGGVFIYRREDMPEGWPDA